MTTVRRQGDLPRGENSPFVEQLVFCGVVHLFKLS